MKKLDYIDVQDAHDKTKSKWQSKIYVCRPPLQRPIFEHLYDHLVCSHQQNLKKRKDETLLANNDAEQHRSVFLRNARKKQEETNKAEEHAKRERRSGSSGATI